MNRIYLAFMVAAFLSVAVVSRTWAAAIVGSVIDRLGNPVMGVQISVRDMQNHVVGQDVTGPNGKYTIDGLLPGQYQVSLKPLATGYIPQTVVAHLGSQKLTVKWTVSRNAPALATATSGTRLAAGTLKALGAQAAAGTAGPLGMSTGTFALSFAGASAVLTGGIVGGIAAAGGLGGGGGSKPASPSL